MKPNSQKIDFSSALESRRDEIAKWLKMNGPECGEEQRHLDEGTDERTYWHFGYLVAIRDVLELLGDTSTSRH